jgi:hypothetical protein
MARLRMAANPVAHLKVATSPVNKVEENQLPLMGLLRMAANPLPPEALPRGDTNLANKAAENQLLLMARLRMAPNSGGRLRVATSLVNKGAENQLPLMASFRMAANPVARRKVATSLVNKAVLAANRLLRMAAGPVIRAGANPLPVVK